MEIRDFQDFETSFEAMQGIKPCGTASPFFWQTANNLFVKG